MAAHGCQTSVINAQIVNTLSAWFCLILPVESQCWETYDASPQWGSTVSCRGKVRTLLRASFLISNVPQLIFFCLSGSFTPSRHIRPSSGREHTIDELIKSCDNDSSMNETRRKPTTGRQSPSLCDKWHGIFYMPSRIDTAVHTKAFDYPVAEHWGGQNVQPREDSNSRTKVARCVKT